ncbi:MAG: Shedu immune nuclease family protein [Candidatus Geothermincolia bacterium]
MPWARYRAKAEAQWLALLQNCCDESVYQSFLEENPSFFPLRCTFTGEGHHGMFPHAVISQPRLSGLSGNVPDFMWISRDSECIYPTMIELESPGKKWFTKTNCPTAQLTQALNQLREWKLWFENTSNRTRFLDEYQVPSGLYRARSFRPRYILIYGRRRELEGTTNNMKRTQMRMPDEELITYDRLYPDDGLSSCLTVHVTGTGYEALCVPPTLELGPALAQDFSLINSKHAAIQRSKGISRIRKEFLIRRSNYWDEWARTHGTKVMSPGDCE